MNHYVYTVTQKSSHLVDTPLTKPFLAVPIWYGEERHGQRRVFCFFATRNIARQLSRNISQKLRCHGTDDTLSTVMFISKRKACLYFYSRNTTKHHL